jgi:pentatricopeptide repeat protein
MDELLSFQIQVSSSSGDENTISMVQFMTPRDQSDLIRLLGKSSLYTHIIEFLKHLNGSNDDKIYSYTTAILAVASSKFKKRAMQLLDEMEERQIIPNTYTYTATFLSIDDATEALNLLSRARRQGRTRKDLINVHLYNAAIHSCSRDKQHGYHYAISIFRQMPRDDVKPNIQTFASLLHACAQSNKLKIALAIFDEMMHTPGIDMMQADKAWLAALEACASAKNGGKAMEVLEKMLIVCGNDALPSILHLNTVLSALAKEGNHQTASSLLDHMHNGTLSHLFPENGIQLDRYFIDVVSVNTVLSSYAKTKDYEGAKALFHRLKNGEFKSLDQNNEIIVLKPDIISYNTLLSTCQSPEEARRIVVEVSICSYFVTIVKQPFSVELIITICTIDSTL